MFNHPYLKRLNAFLLSCSLGVYMPVALIYRLYIRNGLSACI